MINLNLLSENPIAGGYSFRLVANWWEILIILILIAFLISQLEENAGYSKYVNYRRSEDYIPILFCHSEHSEESSAFYSQALSAHEENPSLRSG